MADSVGIGEYVPATNDTGWFARQEGARTPMRFRDRIIVQFRSDQNSKYLRELFTQRVPRGPLRRHVLETLEDAILSFTDLEGRAYDVLMSDPTARRGVARRAVSFWDEVRRLNRVFYEDRMAFLREHEAIINPTAPRDGVSEDTEDYAMRMFISDSLRPPGLEHLNTPGPSWALREDQSTWIPRAAAGNGASGARSDMPPGARPHGREGFTASAFHSRAAFPDVAGAPTDNGASDQFPYAEDDNPWSAGNANRTPEQAMAEYWGDDKVTSDTMTGAPETMGKTSGEMYAWGNSWQENGGTRFMRYESIPFWQMGGREGYDQDIEETLGTGAREMDNHVRRWDMDVLRKKRGQEYRQEGPRSGHMQ